MKQIKTIIRGVDDSENFDKAVNAALAEGWKLVKREIIPGGEGQTMIFYRALYAELEREAAPRICLSCKHYKSEACDAPCAYCDKTTLDEWEQGTGIVAVPVKKR